MFSGFWHRAPEIPARVTTATAPSGAFSGGIPPSSDGWLPYVEKRPQQDLVLQFTRAYDSSRPFVAIPANFPPEYNVANLYWRLTGVAKMQLVAKGYRVSV